MYNHTAIKQNGKAHYSSHKGSTILTTLVFLLISFAISGVVSVPMQTVVTQMQLHPDDVSYSELMAMSGKIYMLDGILIVISIFFLNIVKASFAGYFTKSVRGLEPSTGAIFAGFKNYGNFLSATFLRDLYITLWSFLFIIPGIVKQYSYSMVDYIISENPSLGANRAIEMSKIMTKGYKGKLFYLDLSFLGWLLLSVFTFYILDVVFVVPYYQSSKAYAYEQLKAIAISEGKLFPENFGDYNNNAFGNTNNNIGGNPYNMGM